MHQNFKKNTINTLFLILIMLALNACKDQQPQSQNQTSTNNGKNQNNSLQKGPWTLNKSDSSIAIVTTKNNSISEVSHFKKFSGKISTKGYFEISIDLNSLETNIPIRNERIQKELFNTEIYPTAEIHTQLLPENLSVGVHKISFDVDLHGVSNILKADFMVFEQNGNMTVTLHQPLIVKAEDFALVEGINVLKNLAALNSISTTVVANIVLNFEPKNP